jgi:hypothetical protein
VLLAAAEHAVVLGMTVSSTHLGGTVGNGAAQGVAGWITTQFDVRVFQ